MGMVDVVAVVMGMVKRMVEVVTGMLGLKMGARVIGVMEVIPGVVGMEMEAIAIVVMMEVMRVVLRVTWLGGWGRSQREWSRP